MNFVLTPYSLPKDDFRLVPCIQLFCKISEPLLTTRDTPPRFKGVGVPHPSRVLSVNKQRQSTRLLSIFMEFHTVLFELKKDCRALNASR